MTKIMTRLCVGFDDTDSPKGMCTTYLAYKIVDALKKENTEFIDYPRLIRFNPNIPWKTRGNGAVGLEVKTNNPSKIKKIVKNLFKKYSDLKNGANPGLVFCEKEKISNEFSKFSNLALWQLIHRKEAKKFIRKNKIDSFSLGNGQGLVGAIGAIGYNFDDQTLELLSYRKKKKFGTKRQVLNESVKLMQEKTFPYTFNSYDTQKGRVLITPRGPDPVFCGIRGENHQSLLLASKLIKADEKLDGYLVFRSNQGTAAHLKNELNINDLRTYSSGTITGIVSAEPKMKKGGHVFFSILVKDKEINCAVYKQTGLGKITLNLIVGDTIKLGGGVRKASKTHPRIINVEFIDIKKLKKIIIQTNPYCKSCNKKMKSKGRDQGFECIKCGKKSTQKSSMVIKREIKNKLYIPKISAHRHLTRPQQRMGIKNKQIEFEDSIPWFKTFE